MDGSVAKADTARSGTVKRMRERQSALFEEDTFGAK